MKKILIVFIAFFLLAAGAAGFFLATFDANHYKGAVTAQLEKVLGKPVTIGDIRLDVFSGLALKVSKLTAPGARLESAEVRVHLFPLLQKKVEVTSILLNKPSIDVIRQANGSLKVAGIDVAAKSAPAGTAQGDSSKAAPAFFLSVDSVAVRGARILYRDLSQPSAAPLEIKNFDINVRNFSWARPFTFDATMALFGDKQNAWASGIVRMPAGKNPAEISNLFLKMALAEFDVRKIAQVSPGFASAGIKGNILGELTVEFDKLVLDPKSLDKAKGIAKLKSGRVVLQAFASPVEDIDAEAVVGGDEIRLNHLTARTAGGGIEFSGRAYGFKTQPRLEMKGAIKELPLGELVKTLRPDAPQLAGHLNLLLEGEAQGLGWDTISKTLNGRARVTIRDGVLLNYNILREVMNKISAIPGAAQALQERFPQAYAMRLQEKSTLLRPVDLSATITNGVFDFNPMRIETDFVMLDGAGSISLSRSLDARANLIVNQEISKAFTSALAIIQTLCNNRGEIVVPVTASGMLPQVKIVPDTQYLSSKLLAGTTQDIVGQLVSDPSDGLDKIQNLLKKNLKGIKI